MAEKINLFDDALGLKGKPPVEVAVGEGVDLSIKRTFTGEEVARWAAIEQTRIEEATKLFRTSVDHVVQKTDTRAQALKKVEKEEAARQKKLDAIMATYLADFLELITADETAPADREEAARRILGLESEARARVLRHLGTLSGLVGDDGAPFYQVPKNAL